MIEAQFGKSVISGYQPRGVRRKAVSLVELTGEVRHNRN